MLGEEYSMMTFLPFPDVLVPYSGSPDADEYVRSWIWSSTLRIRVVELSWKCRNALSCTTDSTHSSASN